MNSEGLLMAPLAFVKHLIRIASDHCPLLLNIESATPKEREQMDQI